MASIINASTSGAGGLIQTADSSGVLALQAAGTTIASVSGTGVAVTGNVSSTGTVADSLGTLRPLVSGTAVASTSGTSVDFTNIPSWVKRITVMFSGVSTSGTSSYQIQIGAGSVTTSGYFNVSVFTGPSSSGFSSTTGIWTVSGIAAANSFIGSAVLTNLSGNAWVSSGSVCRNDSYVMISNGSITLGGTLDRIRITTVNGTDTFDAGSINIMYE